MSVIYLIGSLRNPDVPELAQILRKETGHEVFDDWYAAGDKADDAWRDYEKARGHTYVKGLQGHAAAHVFEFDYFHLQRSDAAVLFLPAGKSAHLELGWMLGSEKPGYVLLDSPDRWDVMYKFATGVFDNLQPLVEALRRLK